MHINLSCRYNANLTARKSQIANIEMISQMSHFFCLVKNSLQKRCWGFKHTPSLIFKSTVSMFYDKIYINLKSQKKRAF